VQKNEGGIIMLENREEWIKGAVEFNLQIIANLETEKAVVNERIDEFSGQIKEYMDIVGIKELNLDNAFITLENDEIMIKWK